MHIERRQQDGALHLRWSESLGLSSSTFESILLLVSRSKWVSIGLLVADYLRMWKMKISLLEKYLNWLI